MTISFAELSMILGQLWWPFFRVGAVFISMPFFGDALIPVWVRSLLALSIVVITAPLMPPMPEVELFSMTSLFLAFEQAIWGVMFGLILHMLFNVFTMLGQVISLQMGLGMAMMNDPVNGLSVAILGRIFLIFSTLLFLALEGHLLVIDIVIQSFVVCTGRLRYYRSISSRHYQHIWVDVCLFTCFSATGYRVHAACKHQLWCDEPSSPVT